MSFVSTRFLRTEAFRLSAIYAVIFALSALALGTIVFILADRAFRDQIKKFSRADIAAIRHGYIHEGLDEAREVVGQVMAAPGVRLLPPAEGRRAAGRQFAGHVTADGPLLAAQSGSRP